MKCLSRWLFAVAVATVMWGCSWDKVSWDDGFMGAKVVGFIDDSLVIVGSFQQRKESHEGVFEPYWDVVESGHERLCVYNYRVQEDGPRWCDTLDEYNMTNAFRGQMTDSIIWGGNLPNSIRLWKVGETQHEIKLKKTFDNCSDEFGIASVKQWFDGMFIAYGDKSLNADGDNCQYAVLDTVERTLVYKRLDENLKWIEKCDDVRAWGDDVYCLELDKETYDAKLLINESLKFIMERNQYKLGDYANVSFMGPYLKLHQTVYKYRKNEIKRMTSFSSQGISFGDGKGNYITY